jgi:hypothetical protein
MDKFSTAQLDVWGREIDPKKRNISGALRAHASQWLRPGNEKKVTRGMCWLHASTSG